MDTPLLRVGLFGIGLDAYWTQFAGLEQRLEGYLDRVAQRLARPGVHIVNAGLVDSRGRAHAAGREFRRQEVDVIFLDVTTYALSSTVLPVVMRAKVPVVVLNLAPEPAIEKISAPLRVLAPSTMFGQVTPGGNPSTASSISPANP